MKVEKRDDGKILLLLNRDEFFELSDAMAPVERIAYETLLLEGLDNLILDFPIGKVIAVFSVFEVKNEL